MEDVSVTALCDVYEDRVKNAAGIVEKISGVRPAEYLDYKKMLKTEKLDGVVIATSWQTHIMVALEAMRNNIPAGIEVGAASTVEDCHALVRTYEATGTWCMMLQNCNYGRNELALLNMVQKEMFGELVHIQCGYEHDIREEIAKGHENRHYRLDNYLNRNGEIYPMHGLGPMMKLLRINRGNRMVSLVSMSSKARGLKDWAKNNLPADHHLQSKTVNQGDVVNTLIKCSNGETILVTHDTTLPRPYSRGGRVQGTKGIWMEDNRSIYIEGQSPNHQWEPFSEYVKNNELEHPIWKEYLEQGVKAGHGGMDYLVLRAFIEDGIGNNLPPFDIFDTAALNAIVPLSEKSIALGSVSVEIPDFTNGRWIAPAPVIPSKYCLNI